MWPERKEVNHQACVGEMIPRAGADAFHSADLKCILCITKVLLSLLAVPSKPGEKKEGIKGQV